MTPNINIIDLAEKHGQTSYRNRADTKHPAYGFTEEGLQAFAHALLAAAPQAVQATEEMRVCNSEECGWIGPLSETYGYKNSPATLCPECKETTELSAPAHPAEGVPAQDAEAKIEELLALARIMVRTALDADNKTQVQEIKAAIESEVAFERVLRAALAATQPAAQGLEQHAERWGEVLRHVGAAPHFGGQHFTLNPLQAPDTALGFKANLMSGSVAQHFTKAIDAERAARAKQRGA